MALMGVVVNHSGAWLASAKETILARGFRPKLFQFFFPNQDNTRGPVIDLGSIGSRDGAFLSEYGFECGHFFKIRLPEFFVFGDNHWLFAADFHRHELLC